MERLEERILLSAAVGGVNVFANGVISGFAFDADSPGHAVQVAVVIDSTVKVVTANTARPDNTQGFVTTIPPGQHFVALAALDVQGVAPPTVFKTGTMTNAVPIGSITAATTTSVTGFAYDANQTATPLQVQIKVDGVLKTTVSASTPIAGNPARLFTASLSGVDNSPHYITMAVQDAPSGTFVNTPGGFILNNHVPIGIIQSASPAVISGWAADLDTLGKPVKVEVVVDGNIAAATTATASNVHTDLSIYPTLGNAHGFDVPTPTENFGTHVVTVYAVDTFDGAWQIIGSKSYTDQRPIGIVAGINKTGVVGFAFDPDNPADSIKILIAVDGQQSQTQYIANRPFPGVVGNHGFAIAFQNLAPGTHHVQIFAVDDSGAISAISTQIGPVFTVVA